MRAEDAPQAGPGARVRDGRRLQRDVPRIGANANVRAAAKSLLLGAAGAKLLLSVPSGWWESSAHRGATTLVFDAAWAVGLTGCPSLIGWRQEAAWRGAAIVAAVALGGAAFALALRPHGPVTEAVDLALRLARLSAESLTAIGVLAMTGAWLVVAPRR